MKLNLRCILVLEVVVVESMRSFADEDAAMMWV